MSLLMWIGWVGIGLSALGILMVAHAVRRGGPMRVAQGVVVGALVLAVGALASGLAVALKSFHVFAGSTVVAEAQCQRLGPQEFELTLVTFHGEQPQPPQTARLHGDQWSISGGIVKWHRWLTFLGVPSYHKLDRLSGRHSRLADELTQPPTAMEVDGGIGSLWLWLYDLDPYLPFIEAAYGTAAFAEADPRFLYRVAVTTSGYLISREPLAE